ncbi:dCMP deaminase [Cryptosporidium bovis]|uniref:dCMP deaminase n=1 Tax=Cryptosporidium bovis TaxID=310047 RepID=UPI00351A46AA|nr:dCMP deaminase [Cryptosporidium bovis]
MKKIEKRIEHVFQIVTSDYKNNYLISTTSRDIEFNVLSNTFFISIAIDISLLSVLSIKLELSGEKENCGYSIQNLLCNNSDSTSKENTLDVLLYILKQENNEKV